MPAFVPRNIAQREWALQRFTEDRYIKRMWRLIHYLNRHVESSVQRQRVIHLIQVNTYALEKYCSMLYPEIYETAAP